MIKDVTILEDWQVLGTIELCKKKMKNAPAVEISDMWESLLERLEKEKETRNLAPYQ